MRNVGKRQVTATRKAWANVLTLAVWGAISGGAVATLTGCEKMEGTGRAGDRAVDVAVSDSIANPDPAKAAADVKSAVANASNVGKARGSSELARDEFNQAMALVPEIERQTQAAESALYDLRQAAAEVNEIQQTSGSYTLHDPKDTIAKLDEERANLQKAAEQAKTNAGNLKGELDKRQQEIDALKAERQKADADADALAQKSNDAKGQEAVNFFKQSTEARTKSGTLAAQIEVKTAALMPLQHQLAMAEGQQKLYDNAGDPPGAVQQLDNRKAQITAAWQGNQQQAQAIADTAKRLADEVVTPGKVKGADNAGARFVAAMQAADTARSQAEKLLQSAATDADNAFKAADALHKDYAKLVSEAKPQSPDITAYQAMMAAFDEKQYAIQKGVVNTALGNLYANQYTLASHAKQALDEVAQALQTGGQTVPGGLAAPNPDAAKAGAEKAYAAAEQALESVVNATGNTPGSKEMKANALASLMITRYGHYELTLDDATRARLKDDVARAKEASIPVPNSVNGI